MRDMAVFMLNNEGIDENITDAVIMAFIQNKITKDRSTEMIDLMEFAKYKPSAGFKFSVDGIHKCPVNTPCVAIYCRNPEGELYKNIPKSDEIHLCAAIDWNSPVESPHFNDGFYTYKNIPFEPNMHIIVDIRTVIFNKKNYSSYKMKQVGWTIVPIFDKR
jgi:hypothetical protein